MQYKQVEFTPRMQAGPKFKKLYNLLYKETKNQKPYYLKYAENHLRSPTFIHGKNTEQSQNERRHS